MTEAKEKQTAKDAVKKEHKKLGELSSTAICGNDISSSVLYVSALAIFYAGQYAWITLLIVSLVLFFFRKIISCIFCDYFIIFTNYKTY